MLVVDPDEEPELEEDVLDEDELDEDVLLGGAIENWTRRLGTIILAMIVAASALDIAE